MTVLALTRDDLADYILVLAGVYTLIIIAHIVIQIAFQFGARVPYSLWTDRVFDFLRQTAEPYLRVFRRFVPMIGPLDLSPLVGIFALQIAASVLAGIARG